jgi:chemotaxis protein methyltransferase CheR
MELATVDQAGRRDASIIPNGEFPLTAADFRKIAALVHGEAGIVVTEGKANLVYSRLVKRLRAIGLRSFREYCAYVESGEGGDERVALIAAMTTNVTRFFREPHHFDHLRSLAGSLKKSAQAGHRVRLWSAACSSGEEPYSIAMTLLDAIPEIGELDILVLATDIDPNMVARGIEGRYPASGTNEIPPRLRDRFVLRQGSSDMVQLAPEVRALVRFRELNLLADWPMSGHFDVIFCRNVMIYFDDRTQNQIWRKFAGALNAGGTLLIGHSERIATEQHPFELVGQTVYRLQETRS